MARDRTDTECEENIPLGYLEDLKGQHERMVADFRAAPGCRVYDADSQQDMAHEDIAQAARTLIATSRTRRRWMHCTE